MIHLRLVVPGTISKDVVDYLCRDSRVLNVVVMTGVARNPPGDMLLCDVAREATSDVVAGLRELGLDERATVAMEEIDTITSTAAEAAEKAAPGSPDDGIVWESVAGQARSDARGSWAFHAFLTLATLIAAVAVLTDSSILVVGAMVVGPEFGPVSAIAVGLVLGLRRITGDAVRLLALGFPIAIAITAAAALAGRAAGWITAADVSADRPLTGFIWTPDRWSFVVALLAGAAGVLSLTAGRSNALVGVFISVTTVPAAGNLALALALWVPNELGGAAAQLAVNLTGMVIAGCLVLGVQRAVTSRQRGIRWLLGRREEDSALGR
jgi:uncharacterized hydrophobic protein (TIGR00271 family)